MLDFLKRQPTARLIAIGFAFVILTGSVLLWLPISVKSGSIRYIDALYMSTSAVCVTGLAVTDVAGTFTVFGQVVLGLLIQIGGLGITAIGAGVILAMGKKMNLKGNNLIHDAMNLDSTKSAVSFVKELFLTTLIIEGAGAALSFIVFSQKFDPLKALGVSVFHSVAAFNNSGFDILGTDAMGNFSLMGYRSDYLLNMVTALLIFFGGIGFLVIKELWTKKFNFRKLSMHSKVVLSMSGVLIVLGTLLIKLTEKGNISWLGAFFTSVSARTAGFATFSIRGFSQAGRLLVIILMFIGASPGSTGGGIKTSTFFVILQGLKSAATNKTEKAFSYSIPKSSYRKASVIAILSAIIVLVSTLILLLAEPFGSMTLSDALFEMVSAFGTVGLSTGITPGLGCISKILSILVMFIGRLGPMTIATLWYFSLGERVRYPEGDIAIG